MTRGEVWLVALDPTVGSEIQKTRPCLVVSPPDIHDHLRTAIIAPITSGSRPAPYRIEVAFQGRNGRVLLEQTRAVDKSRFIRRMGSLPGQNLGQALRGLRELFED